MKPHGILFARTLNYERILANQDRVQSSKESGNKTFVRFYDYDEHGILFNILTLEREGSGVAEKLESIRLRPVLREELESILSEAGFLDVKAFGGISMEPFESATSKDLVIVAKK